MTKNEVDLKEILENDYILPGTHFDGTYTKTSLFMSKAIGLDLYSNLSQKHVVNLFLDDKGYEHDYVTPIFILLRAKYFEDATWHSIYSSFKESPYYLNDYDLGQENGHNLVMMVVQCNPKYKNEYYKFKRGFYSEFSDEYKNLFKRDVLLHGERRLSIPYGVFKREDYILKIVAEKVGWSQSKVSTLKEIWGIPVKEREYYRYNQNEHRTDSSASEERQSETEAQELQ